MMSTYDQKWRKLRRELDSPCANSYVYKAGFKYAIVWPKRSFEIEMHISRILGPANKKWHFDTVDQPVPLLKENIATDCRWFYGPRAWSSSNKNHPYWAVFKSEKDRTIVLLSL
jgi:hypothetical protein